MFSGYSNLKNVDLGNWILTNPANTSNMFSVHSAPESLNLSGYDTKVNDSGFNVSNVPDTVTLECGTDNSAMLATIRNAF